MFKIFNLSLIIFFGSLTLVSANTNVSLALKWKHQFKFAGYYIAKEKVCYKASGLEIETIEASGRNIFDDVQNRTVDLTDIDLNGFIYQTEYHLDKELVKYSAFILVVLIVTFLLYYMHRYNKNKILKKLKNEYQQFFDLAPLPYQSLDVNGNLVRVNQAWLDELGYDMHEVIGKSFDTFLVPEQASLFRKRFSKFKRTGISKRLEFIMLTKSGEEIIILLNGCIISDDRKNFLHTNCIFDNITKSKEMEQKIKELDETKRNFIKNFNGILFSGDIDYTVTLFTGKVEEITGYQAEEFLKNDLRWSDIIHPDDIKIFDKDLDIKNKTGYSSNRSYRIIKKDASIANIQEYIYNISDQHNKPLKVEGIIYDITEKTLLEKNFQSIFDVIPDILITTNGEYIDNANPAMLKFFGYKNLEEFTSEHDCICDFFIERSGYLKAEMDGIRWLKYITSHPDNLYKTSMKQNSKKHTFIVWARPFSLNVSKKESDTDTHYIVMFNDITELEDKDKIMLAQSRHAAMGEMIGMIAHQWRQPITTIAMGANNIIVDSALGDTTEDSINEYSNEIIEQTQYLSKTIDDFRDFFKPNKEKEDIKVCSVLDETLAIIGTSLANNNIEIEKELNCQSYISTYSRELLQVYINILKNAKEALVEREIKNAKIVITVTEDKNSVITNICDNAGGIKPDVLPKIFEPYFTTKDERTGTGLGLYMSVTIVNKHLGGNLSVKNTHEGTCFTIVLPKIINDDIDE